MTRCHGLNEIESLTSADFSDYDSVGSHAKRRLEQVANGDAATAANVRRLRLQVHDVGQANSKLLRIFDDHEALVFRSKRCQRIEQGGLPRAATPRNDDIVLLLDDRTKEKRDVSRYRAKLDEAIQSQLLTAKAPDAHHRPRGRRRRNDRFDPGTIWKPGFQDRLLRVELTAHELRKIAKCRHQVVLGCESAPREMEPAPLLDVDLVVTVDHDFGHGLALEQGNDWGEQRGHRLLEYMTRNAHGACSSPELASTGKRKSCGPSTVSLTSLRTDLASAAWGPWGASRRYSSRCVLDLPLSSSLFR